MQIRFGYVAIALNIPEGSPNKTVTLANLMKIGDQADRISRLRRLTRQNLETQLRVLRYNAAHNIHVFRFTSRLVPLATHPETAGWDYLDDFRKELKEIGNYIHDHDMRVSAHPDHYTLLNSPDEGVLKASLADLAYHAGLFDAMGLSMEAKLVVHVGGGYRNKREALNRFKRSYHSLSPNIKGRLIIENDDKTYTAKDVLELCQDIGAPMVLDIHHHVCCNNGEAIEELLPAIFATWGNGLPKIHVSSPKDDKKVRAHADFIDPDFFLNFLGPAGKVGRNFDAMLEAKQKDVALFRLMDNIRSISGIRVIDPATVEAD